MEPINVLSPLVPIFDKANPSLLSMGWLLPIPIYAGFALAYWKLAPKFETDRQRAYILSTISAFVMTLISLPFLWTYLVYGLETVYEAAQGGWLGMVGRFGVVFFGTYLFADLLIGYRKYPSQVGLLTGWIHHTVYFGLMIYCLNTRQSPLFLIGGIMELPTFDLAISNLFPALRNDFRFLSSFFLIRISFHLAYFIDCVRPSSRKVMGNAWTPLLMLILAFAMHVSWFRGGVMGYLKRRSKATPDTMAAIAPGEPTLEDISSFVENKGEVEYESESGTPNDSPLITPHTPRTVPNLTNMPNLPNLPGMPQLPSLAHMPTVSIPSFSNLTAALHAREPAFGFKEAVKNRWEEQRDRFAEIRRGNDAALTFGGVGVRRRAGIQEAISDEDDGERD